jgi:class 3 adenylate cyclase
VAKDDSGRIKRLNTDPRLLKGAKAARKLLPGDERYGDPLSTAGEKPSQLAGKQLSELTKDSPGVMRELGLGALQVWQAMSEAQGRGRGEIDLAIVFTDLAEFSTWALEKGDTLALELLRQVAEAIEPPMRERGGKIVKRLGDGLMAVFADTGSAVDAVLEARERVQTVEVGGHRPQLRAGIHLGRPRRIGGDYLGVDVNIAARLVEGASAGEILASDRVVAELGDGQVEAKRRRWKAKGAPKDLEAYSLNAAG